MTSIASVHPGRGIPLLNVSSPFLFFLIRCEILGQGCCMCTDGKLSTLRQICDLCGAIQNKLNCWIELNKSAKKRCPWRDTILSLPHSKGNGSTSWSKKSTKYKTFSSSQPLSKEKLPVKVRSHQKRNYFSRRPKRVSLLARPFTVFSP